MPLYKGALQPSIRLFSNYACLQEEKKVEVTADKPPASTSLIGRLYQQSKDLVRFYKDGIKLLWSNKKEAQLIMQKVKNESYEWTRSEYQLVHQSKKDVVKLIPFAFVFLILPESIPLLVLYVPGMVPSTCVKESQLMKQREKLDKIRQKMNMNVLKSAEQIEAISPEDFLNRTKFLRINKQYGFDFDLSRIDRRHLESYCRFMGISDFGTQGILKRRLTQYLDYIMEDDKLIVKEDLVDKLNHAELSKAIEERGMKSGGDDLSMRKALKYWLSFTVPSSAHQDRIPYGLLVFSRMFLLNARY
ncbi:LETM1-like protein-domain-containing protein [Pilobolus umbonatus]|nr:LETM1-like protein-domain-containing protein [Pilobolus umbonatus]